MGIYDRDYYRKDAPGFLERLIPQGSVCKWLIGITVAVFVAQLLTQPPPIPFDSGDFPQIMPRGEAGRSSAGWVTDTFILDPTAVLHGQVWRLLSYAFLHEPTGLLHILFNMLFLWWFGSDLEALYGSREFLLFYLVAATLGGVAYTAWSLVSPTGPCLGASGAITALLVLYACHFPQRSILIFFFLPVPIWLFAIFNVAQDAFIFLGRFHTQVAVVVHLAGAVFAFAYFKSPLRLKDVPTALLSWRHHLTRPRARIYRPPVEHDEPREPVSVAAPAERPVDEHFEAKLDAVLEKIARSGKDSLTEAEREILRRASEHYKKKRS